MKWEAFEDRSVPGQWRVEAIDHESEGECYTVIFCGFNARMSALEYAFWKNAPERTGLFQSTPKEQP